MVEAAATPHGRTETVARPVIPPLADPPVPSPFWAWFGPRSHTAFTALNRVMAPALDAGLGPWISTPVGGYILLLKVTGRRSRKTIRVPLSYTILDGAAWVMAGYGVRTQWYRNVLADPAVRVVLPGRAFEARAEEVRDPAIRARVMPKLARDAGLPGFLVGCDPWTASDARILELLDWIPLIRLAPPSGPLPAGPDDPGGRAWIRRQAMVFAIAVEIGLAVLWRRRRH